MRTRGKRIGPALVTGTLVAVSFATRAEAHLVTTGLGPVYDGITHVLVSPGDLLAIVAMALLAGLNGAAAARRTLFVLTAAWLAGGCAGAALARPWLPEVVTTVSLLALGVLVALDRRLPPSAVVALAAAIGLAHGWLNGASIAIDRRDPLGLVGIAAAVFVLVALAAAVAVRARAGTARIVVRVAGSWMAAIGLLMLGWHFRR